MTDYLYLDDYINLYSKKTQQIIKIMPYKDTLLMGRIINKDKFIKKLAKVIKEYKLKNNIFNNNINVIINKNITKEDKEIIKDTLELLNYKKIKFLSEIDYLLVDKKKLYIIYNYTYFYLYYIDYYGNLKILMYDYNINKDLILHIIKLLNKDKIIIYGKNYLELLAILKGTKLDYYFYEEGENYILYRIIYNL